MIEKELFFFIKPREEVSTPPPVSTAPTAAPSVVANLVATPGDKKVILTWSPNPTSEGVTGNLVSQDGVVAVLYDGAPITRFEIPGLTNGTSYRFKVRAKNSIGNSFQAAITCTPVAGAVTGPQAPIVDFDFTQDASDATMQTFNFESRSSGTGALTYAWRTVDGISLSTLSAFQRKFTTVGERDIILKVTDANGLSAEKTKTIRVGAGAVTPPPTETPIPTPSGLPYKADPAFDIEDRPYETRQLYAAFMKSVNDGKFYTNAGNYNFSSFFPSKIDLYGLRGSKVAGNDVTALLATKKDPKLVEILYNLIDDVLTRFELRWIKYPTDTVLRNDAGTIIPWKTYSDRQDGLKAANEFPTKKKLLYLNEKPHKKGGYLYAEAYGTQMHELDNLLGHGWLARVGYILDVNRSLNPKYATAADILYDYFFNHWEYITSRTFDKHGTKRYYQVDKSLHHAHAAHASLYEAFIFWHQLGNTEGRTGRLGAARADDVTAFKNMMKNIIDDFYLYNFPANVTDFTNSENYEFANHAHNNVSYIKSLGGSNTNGDGDCTYDPEFASEIINFYINGSQDLTGRQLTKRYFTAMSNTYARIVEPKQKTGSKYNAAMAGCVSGGDQSGDRDASYKSPGPAWMTDGKSVEVKHGRSMWTHTRTVDGVKTTTKKGPLYLGGHPTPVEGLSRRSPGGHYIWADVTPNHFNLRAWMRRAKYYGGTDIQALIKNPTTASGYANNLWVLPAIISTVLNPTVKLADIDVGSFTGVEFRQYPD